MASIMRKVGLRKEEKGEDKGEDIIQVQREVKRASLGQGEIVRSKGAPRAVSNPEASIAIPAGMPVRPPSGSGSSLARAGTGGEEAIFAYLTKHGRVPIRSHYAVDQLIDFCNLLMTQLAETEAETRSKDRLLKETAAAAKAARSLEKDSARAVAAVDAAQVEMARLTANHTAELQAAERRRNADRAAAARDIATAERDIQELRAALQKETAERKRLEKLRRSKADDAEAALQREHLASLDSERAERAWREQQLQEALNKERTDRERRELQLRNQLDKFDTVVKQQQREHRAALDKAQADHKQAEKQLRAQIAALESELDRAAAAGDRTHKAALDKAQADRKQAEKQLRVQITALQAELDREAAASDKVRKSEARLRKEVEALEKKGGEALRAERADTERRTAALKQEHKAALTKAQAAAAQATTDARAQIEALEDLLLRTQQAYDGALVRERDRAEAAEASDAQARAADHARALDAARAQFAQQLQAERERLEREMDEIIDASEETEKILKQKVVELAAELKAQENKVAAHEQKKLEELNVRAAKFLEAKAQQAEDDDTARVELAA